MDWIWSLFSWEMAGLAALGMLGLAALMLIARVYRRGLGSYGESHKKMAQRIRDTDTEIREHNWAMPPSEQIQVLLAAMREVLELEGSPQGCGVRHENGELVLDTAQGPWRVRYGMRKSVLRGTRRVMYGAGQWEVRHPHHESRSFRDLAQLTSFLRTCLRPEKLNADREAEEAFMERHFRH